MSGLGFHIATFDAIDAVHGYGSVPLSAILVYAGGDNIVHGPIGRSIRKLVSAFRGVPVIIQSDNDDLQQVATALHYGIRGYLSSNVGVEVFIEAISLAVAGGIFIAAENTSDLQGMLAKKQVARSMPGCSRRVNGISSGCYVRGSPINQSPSNFRWLPIR